MAKPFSIQAPEDIAKEYAGNKQMIAQAAQMGIVDPTAAVLAGMFIDRMRSAQVMEAAPQQTVAQQVLGGGGQPPAPPAGLGATPQAAPPMEAPAGLGATPEAAMMAPPQDMAPQEMAPQEMGAPEATFGGGGKVHGRFNASEKGSSYGIDVPMGDDAGFTLEGAGRRIFDPDIIKAILRLRKGKTDLRAEHTLDGGSEYAVERPFLGGRLGVRAGASRGFVPDSVQASYRREFAEGGMVPPYASGGGLSDVPVPDGMFDEPSNGGFGDGYAGGGMVAFSNGGGVDPTNWMRAPVTSKYGVKRSTGSHQGVDFGVGNRTPIGVPAPGKVIKVATDAINGNFVVVQHPDGTRSSYSHLAEFNVKPGQEVGTGEVIGLSGNTGRVRGKSGGHHLHFGARDAEGNRIDPMEFFKRIGPQVASGKFRPYTPERDTSTAQGRGLSYEDSAELAGRMLKDPEEYARAKEEARARFEEMRSPEYYEKQRKSDMWQTLAEIGFNMASSKAPSVLQAIGEAASAAMPGARADKKERKALKDRALDGLLRLGAEDRAQAKEILSLGTDIYRTGLQQEQFEQELDFKKQVSNAELAIARQQLQIQLLAATARGTPDAASQIYNDFKNGTEAQRTVIRDYLKAKGGGAETLFPKDDSAANAAVDPFKGFSASRN